MDVTVIVQPQPQKSNSQGGPVDVQVFSATGAGTWTKPTTFTPKVVEVVMWGGGGGGGRGAIYVYSY